MENLALQWGPTGALAIAGGYLALTVLTIRRRGLSGAVERWFTGYLILSAVWTVAWALANIWGWIQPWVVDQGATWTIYMAALLPVGLALLTWHFLPQRGVRELGLLGVVWIVALVLVERGVVGKFRDDTVLNVLRLVGWAGFTFSALVMTALEYIRLRRPLHRNRVLYWLVALIVITLSEGLQYYASQGVAKFGLPIRLIGAITMGYAITTYSLPDLKSAGRHFLLNLVMLLVRILLFLAAILAAWQFIHEGALGNQQQRLFTMAAWLAIAVLLALLQVPLQKMVVGVFERLLFGPGYDAGRALRNYSQSISNILHIERLAAVAIETIAEALDVDRGALLLITEQERGGANVRVVSGMGGIPEMNVAFAQDSPVLRALRENSRPLTQYDIDMLPDFRNIIPIERQWQWALDVEVYIPIHAKRTLIGALVLGPKQTGEPYYAQDLDVLNTLAGQTAVALENARLFDDLRWLNMEISQLNEDLTQVNTRLQKLDKAKSDFLNITSHELRTPLTQVRGYADILGEMIQQEDVNRPYLTKVTGSIRKATDRLEAIYSAMIDVSAIGVDALQFHFEPVRPAVFVSQAVEKWAEALEQRKQSLEVNGIEDLPPLHADQERLVQAFSNLVNNAIKFTPDGGRIEIWGRLVKGPESVIELVIADTGIGIDPEDQELIFEKFYRVGSADLHSTGNVKFKGAGPGLGLTIAKGVVEGHGGRIWVESDRCDEERLPGSRFHILLPMRGDPPDPAEVAERLQKTRPVTGLSSRLAAKPD